VLKSLEIENFTVFLDAKIKWSPGLNVIVGENGTGKSQLMRLAYALSYVSSKFPQSNRQDKVALQRAVAEKIVAVCKPEALGRLVSRQQGRGRCEIKASFVESLLPSFQFSFATNSLEVKVEKPLHLKQPGGNSVFFPTHEMLSVFPGFIALYDAHQLAFDETYYDLAKALAIPARKRHPDEVKGLIKTLEGLIEGHIVLENDGFYLTAPGRGKLEAPLLAEGIRKLASLVFLLMNGSLNNKGTLFWDEPETNLNPKLIRSLARALFTLGASGFQVVLSTHSLFLLREIQILAEASKKRKAKVHPIRFIGLSKTPNSQFVNVANSESLDDIDPLVLLDEDLQQTERYLVEG
jgi:ABC-type transport system involved in cytochrome c biogenesis ATPase subunit